MASVVVKSEPAAAEASFSQAEVKQEAGEPPVIGGVGSGRRVSTADIQLVQNLIERCLQLYMSQREVVSTLQEQARVEPGFTQLVWQKLEEQNPDFFRAYYTRLKLKDQIVLFNHLLDQQVGMFQKMAQRSWGLPGALPSFSPQQGGPLPPFPAMPPRADGEPLGGLGSPGGLPTSSEDAVARVSSQQHLEALGRAGSTELGGTPGGTPGGDAAASRGGGAGGFPLDGPGSGGGGSGGPQGEQRGRGQPAGPAHQPGSGDRAGAGGAGSPYRSGFRDRSSSTADLTRLPRNFSLSDLAMGHFEHTDADPRHHLPRNTSSSQLGHVGDSMDQD